MKRTPIFNSIVTSYSDLDFGAVRLKPLLCSSSLLGINHLKIRLGVQEILSEVDIGVCLFVVLLYVPSQQLWSWRDGQFT